MPFLLLIIGAILAIAAFNNAQGTLASELETDVPAFMKWALALAAVGALGWIPGMLTISRYLLALVVTVLVINNWSQIQQGFSNFAGNFGAGTSGTASTTSATPTTAYIANPNAPQITSAEISGQGQIGAATAANITAQSPLPGSLVSSSATPGNINAAGQTATVTSPYGAYDPAGFLAAFEAGFGGFGGVV